jgi:hypothetical protein
MKRLFILLTLTAVFISANSQNAPAPKDPVGKWKFDAPYAPEGYNSGTIEVKMAEQKLSATIQFTGSEYLIPLEKVKFENDTLSCNLFIDTEDIQIKLKFEEADKMAGNALSSGGEVPLTLVRVKENEK